MEKEIEIELTEKKEIKYISTYKGAYQKDSAGNVICLALEELKLKKLPGTILEFKNLNYLSLYGNQLSTLPPEIRHLTNLTFLSMQSNQLSTLPPEIRYLTNLRELYLAENKLSTLPFEITQMTKLSTLTLGGNPLEQPPPEIVKQGIPAIFEYLGQLAEVKVNEAKLILVGQGDVGKTCLAKRLIYDTFQSEDSTEGIDIFEWKIIAPTKEEEQIRLNAWDFGGQEIYHSTHQFFLTKRSLYLLVWNARKSKDYDHIEYWLHTIEAFGEDSPVILVLSKCREREDDLNMKDLREKFPNIVDLYKVDSRDGTGIEQLKQVIREQAWKLPHMQATWIDSWLTVRQRLEADKRNWIGYAEFKEICKSEGLDEKQSDILDGYLHDLGVIIHFRDRVELKNMVILKPEWATDAVYKILDFKSVRQGEGVLLHSELDRIWDSAEYPPDIHPELLKLMERFELSYELPDRKSHLVAELLPSTSPEFEWDETDNLRFYYRYDFLPPGVMPRFVVRAHQDLEKIGRGQRLQWREGAVLKIQQTKAVIKMRRLERLIEIKIHGLQKREMLAIIRNHFAHINSSIRKIKIKQEIPCNCSLACAKIWEYNDLLRLEGKAIAELVCDKSGQKVAISKLLDGYERKEDRAEKVFELLKEGGIHLNVSQKVEQTNIQKQEAKLEAKQAVQIEIDIKVDLPAIQDNFAELKEAMAGADPKLTKELDKIEDCLDEVSPESDKKALAKPFNKMRRFLVKAADEKSDFNKALKGAKKGVEMAQKVGKTYNKFAQWLALPRVPDLFLG